MHSHKTSQLTQDVIKRLPKTDLHLHLDGSLRLSTLIELSKAGNLPLPSYTEEGLEELVFKERYENLVEYLQGFAYTIPLLQTPENLERVSYELGVDCLQDGAYYIEVRFAPQFSVNEKQDIEQVLLSVYNGLKRAQQEHNSQKSVQERKTPEFHFGLIACAMRSFGKGLSKYYDSFLEVHKHSHLNSIYAMASQELVRSCIHARDHYGVPIVGLDLAGAEAGNPAMNHHTAFHLAHKNFIGLTVHAGEAYGPESIYQAITDLYAERIGHGFHLFSANQILDPAIKNKENYVQKLVQNIAKKRITLEVCLTSNQQTIPTLKNLKEHSLGKMLEAQLSVSLCTDNRTVSKTTVTQEVLKAIENFNLSPATLKTILMNGFEHSFFAGAYKEKLDYLKTVQSYYDAINPGANSE